MKGYGIFMKLLIEERIFSWNDRFTVWDEAGNDRYYVEGELFSWGKKLHVCDLSGREVAYIEQQIFTFKPRYSVYANGQLIGEVVREFSFFRPHYTVEGADWDVEGDFWAHDYTVSRRGQVVVDIQKEWFTWGDCYVADIENSINEIMVLAVVLTIDCVLASQNS